MLRKFKEGFGYAAGLVIGYVAVKGGLKSFAKRFDKENQFWEWLKQQDEHIYEECRNKFK